MLIQLQQVLDVTTIKSVYMTDVSGATLVQNIRKMKSHRPCTSKQMELPKLHGITAGFSICIYKFCRASPRHQSVGCAQEVLLAGLCVLNTVLCKSFFTLRKFDCAELLVMQLENIFSQPFPLDL